MMKFQQIHIEETDSTNRWLRDYCEASVGCDCAPTVVVTEYQTAGRGCGTNSWESERGKNLTFSVLIHPEEIPASRQFHISEVVSVALRETLSIYINKVGGISEPVTIKWPNDIYVGDRKICGILIENRLQGNIIRDSIIGIGLNVNQREFVSDAPNPVSLYQIIGHETDREHLLQDFLARLVTVSTEETVSSRYGNCLFRRGKLCVYRDESGCFEATLEDVMPDGRLVLRDTLGHERLYAFKEVEFIL